jgi:hypothetical protein
MAPLIFHGLYPVFSRGLLLRRLVAADGANGDVGGLQTRPSRAWLGASPPILKGQGLRDGSFQTPQTKALACQLADLASARSRGWRANDGASLWRAARHDDFDQAEAFHHHLEGGLAPTLPSRDRWRLRSSPLTRLNLTAGDITSSISFNRDPRPKNPSATILL